MTLTPLSINTASSCLIFPREFVPVLFVLETRECVDLPAFTRAYQGGLVEPLAQHHC